MRTHELHVALRTHDPEHGVKDYLTGAILRMADELGEWDATLERLETVTSTTILIEIYEELEERVNENNHKGKTSDRLQGSKCHD